MKRRFGIALALVLAPRPDLADCTHKAQVNDFEIREFVAAAYGSRPVAEIQLLASPPASNRRTGGLYDGAAPAARLIDFPAWRITPLVALSGAGGEGGELTRRPPRPPALRRPHL